MTRLLNDFEAGTLNPAGAGFNNAVTSVTDPSFASIATVVAPDTKVIVFDTLAVNGAPEKALITAHAAGSSTITLATRGSFEGSSGRVHLPGEQWACPIVASDVRDFTVADITHRNALTSMVAGSYCWVTNIDRVYRYDGTVWRSLDWLGSFVPVDFGADPTGAADSRAAVVSCLTAAATPIQTGLPNADGNTYGQVVWTVGQYTISSAISLPTNRPLRQIGVGGSGADYQWGQRVIISFTTGGFVLDTAQSNALEWDGLYVIGEPALFVDRGSGPGRLRDCELRSLNDTIPAMQIRNAFWGQFEHCTFRSPNTTTPSVLVESSTAFTPGLEGWLFRWDNCRFYNQGVRWDCYGPTTTVVGAGTLFQSCDTENFGATGALLHVRNTHPTQPFTFYPVSVRDCTAADTNAASDLLRVEALGTGQLQMQSIHIDHSGHGGNGYDVNFVSTGGGSAYGNLMQIMQNAVPYVHFAGVNGSGVMGQQAGGSWYYIGDRARTTALEVRINGDTHDRLQIWGDGKIARGDGTTEPENGCVLAAPGSGSPEGVVTAGPGSTYPDTTNGELYIKHTGTGNTGWKIVTHA